MGTVCYHPENVIQQTDTGHEAGEKKESAKKLGGKQSLIVEPPAFRTNRSLERGRVQESARTKAGRKQPAQNCAAKRVRRSLADGRDKDALRLVSNLVVILPETEGKEEMKVTQVASVALYPREPVHLKVAPCHFRVEKTGKIDDQYQTLSVIGKGGYGEVRKVRNRYTNEIRAVKVIAKSKCQMTEKFSDEINILQKLVTPRSHSLHRTTRTWCDSMSSTATTGTSTS